MTIEPFTRGIGDLRLQKIGGHYRAFFRRSTCGAWKTNTESSVLEEIPVTDAFIEWLDAAAEMLGSRAKLDILTIDVIVRGDPARAMEADEGAVPPEALDESNYVVLEVNGTSSGLAPDCAEEDNAHIANLCLDTVLQSLA